MLVVDPGGVEPDPPDPGEPLAGVRGEVEPGGVSGDCGGR